MKAINILLLLILCTTPLYAEQALVLSEIEKIQESIWYLQKDLALQKTSLKEQQAQVERLNSARDKSQQELNGHLTALAKAINAQQGRTSQIEASLTNLSEQLTTLTDEVRGQKTARQEQTGEVATLAESLQALRKEFVTRQANNEQALAEARQQLDETRAQLETLGKDVGGRVEQISLWGAGAILALALILTIGLAFRRSGTRKPLPELKHPPRHEM